MRAILLVPLGLAACFTSTAPTPIEPARAPATTKPAAPELTYASRAPLVNREAMLIAAFVPEDGDRDEAHFRVMDPISGPDHEDGKLVAMPFDPTAERARLVDAANAYLARGVWHPMRSAVRDGVDGDDVEHWHVPGTPLKIGLRIDGMIYFTYGDDAFITPQRPSHPTGCVPPALSIARVDYDPVTQSVFFQLQNAESPGGCDWVKLHGAVVLPFRARTPYPVRLDFD